MEGRIIGPLLLSDFPRIHTSRFGVIPKSSPGKWRLIVDLSAPEGHSVNDGIREDLCSLKYVKVDETAQGVLELGQGAQLAKVDVRSAYRIIPVHAEYRWLLGMAWDGALYVDTTLPFGLRSAPKLFNAVADTIEWIIRQQGVDPVFHYLDDYLLMGLPGSGQCAAHLSVVLAVFAQLGIPIAQEKVEGPLTTLTFLGIEVDTVAMQLRLPATKLAELQDQVRAWLQRKSCLKKELQSLAGKLQHACKVVRPGRTFLRWVFELLRRTEKKHHHIRLNREFHSDLMWWNTYLAGWKECPWSMAQPGSSKWQPSQICLGKLVVEDFGELSGFSIHGQQQAIFEIYPSLKRKCYLWLWQRLYGDSSGAGQQYRYFVTTKQW